MKETRDTTGLPEWANYLMKGNDGRVRAYERDPSRKLGWGDMRGRFAIVDRDIPGRWRDSLTRIIREEKAS